MLDDHVVAVCSPALLARNPDFSLERLADMPLLRFSRRGWRDFFEAAGIDGAEPERGPMFDDALLLLQAAIAGQGIATARLQLARDFIERGELVRLGQTRIPASFDFYITWRDEHPRDLAISQFYRWIEAELAG